ncbi:hypothetical protein NDU88_002953 [Pleurodeles waltl]|uniref:Uncharacterized protein n=1 Tax=Pleurodeles waltl TaxID=8319 RepID=A0AAV7LH63_PLEWA|nr:hypothetical protein NDU88_002953 [Pleurodeles waltl]
MRASPVDVMGFTKAVLTIVANAPGLLGRRVQLPHIFVFRWQGHLDAEPQEEALLCLEAVEVRSEYGVLLAAHQVDAMWTCIILIIFGFSVFYVIDAQLFNEYPGASEIVFADSVKVRVELQNEVPSPNRTGARLVSGFTAMGKGSLRH